MNIDATFQGSPVLSDQIYQFLKEQITQKNLKEGEKLVELSLQKQFSTSRTPIREAIRRLELEGFVELKPRIGCFVKKIPTEAWREAYQARKALEVPAAEVAASRIGDDELADLETILNEMNNCLKKQDLQTYTKFHHDFHRAIVKASGNQLFVKLHIMATEPYVTHPLTMEWYRRVHKKKTSQDDTHRQILEALKTGNSNKMRNLLEAHIQRVLDEPYLADPDIL